MNLDEDDRHMECDEREIEECPDNIGNEGECVTHNGGSHMYDCAVHRTAGEYFCTLIPPVLPLDTLTAS